MMRFPMKKGLLAEVRRQPAHYKRPVVAATRFLS
jgi:hypothetical protein